MSFRTPSTAIFLLLFASAFCHAQTATCTNWKFFQVPLPWTGGFPGGINRWGTIVGGADPAQPPGSSTISGFVRYSNGGFKTYMAPNASQTFFERRNALGVTVGGTWIIRTISMVWFFRVPASPPLITPTQIQTRKS